MYQHQKDLFRLYSNLIPNLYLIAAFSRSWLQGNPTMYACWLDETENKLLSQVSRSCHQMVFEYRALDDFAQARKFKPRF